VKITRQIHQLWVGPKPIPDREHAWCEQMKAMNPTWAYTLHGNSMLEHFGNDPYIKFMLAKGEKWAFITDRLRVLILQQYGGLYIDADAQPLRPFDTVDCWGDNVDFVAAMRSPNRKDVALHRGVPLIDNTFLASAPSGRLIGHISALWSPAQVTGTNNAINGYRTGLAVIEHSDNTTRILNHRYIYCEQRYPESIVFHDMHNLSSWTQK
jgi:Glycosyltransferase sugar-binding region containing DXD motif